MTTENQLAIIENKPETSDLLAFYKDRIQNIPKMESFQRGSSEQKMCELFLNRYTLWQDYMHLFKRGMNDIEAANKNLGKTLVKFLDKFKSLKSQNQVITEDQFSSEIESLHQNNEKFYKCVSDLNKRESKVGFEDSEYKQLSQNWELKAVQANNLNKGRSNGN